MTVLGNRIRVSRYGKARAYGGVPHGLPSWIKPRPFRSFWTNLFNTLSALDSDRISRASSSILQSVRYWTGSHKVEMKPGEWLVVIIGVVTGVVILYVAPAIEPLSATLGPKALPAPTKNTPTTRTGQEWDCTIVEDSEHQVKLVCEKPAEDSLKVVELESPDNSP